jgi:hypothetical protein
MKRYCLRRHHDRVHDAGSFTSLRAPHARRLHGFLRPFVDKGDSMSLPDFEQERKQRNAAWDAATAAGGLQDCRILSSRTGLLESYVARWHYSGGCLDPRGTVLIRLNRYRVRATIRAEAFDVWQDTPSEVKRRFLSATEWQRVVAWVDAAGFWELPSSHVASGYGFGGETWTIEGFRDGRFHFARRTTWSLLDEVGNEVFHLGKYMGQLAGLSLFEDTSTEVTAEQSYGLSDLNNNKADTPGID